MNTARTTRPSATCEEKKEEIRLDAERIPPRLIALARALEAALQTRREGSADGFEHEEGKLH